MKTSLRLSLKSHLLNNAHDKQELPLGYQPNLEDYSTIYDAEYIYIQAGEDITAFQPYGVFGQEKIFSIDEYVTTTMRIARLVIPQFDMKAGQFGFVVYKGECIANVGAAADGNVFDYLAARQTVTDRLFFQSSQPDLVLDGTFAFTLEPLVGGQIANKKICLLGKDGRLGQ